MGSATETKTVAGDPSLPQDAKGIIAQLYAYMEKEGYPQTTKYPKFITRLVRLGANLRDPEDIKAKIAQLKAKDGKSPAKDGTKLQYVYAYDAVATMLKIPWNMPKYRQEEIIPFVPRESELDCLIAACRSRRMAAFLQGLKETFADPSELLGLRWKDISGNVISINKPCKNHLPRQIPVSNRLISMLNSLPKKDERVFPTTYGSLFNCYIPLRKRTAEMQKNPRLLSIDFTAFRTWGGTMMAHQTNGNVLTVKKFLGHRRIENTMKYIGIIDFQNDDYEETTATTPEEIRKLGKAGWTKYDEMTFNGIQMHFYRRSKWFGKT